MDQSEILRIELHGMCQRAAGGEVSGDDLRAFFEKYRDEFFKIAKIELPPWPMVIEADVKKTMPEVYRKPTQGASDGSGPIPAHVVRGLTPARRTVKETSLCSF